MSKITFSRGYNDIKQKVKKSAKYSRSCDNCDYFYMTKDDDEEVCQNPNVIPYDVCVDDETGRIHCAYWKYVSDRERD